MQVLHVLGPSTGGIRQHVASLADGLQKLGWESSFAGPRGVLEGIAELDYEIDFRRLFLPTQLHKARKALAMATDVDLVHAHGLKAAYVASSVNRPRVATVHNIVMPYERQPKRWLFERMQHRIPHMFDQVIAVSAPIAREFSGDNVTAIAPVGPRSKADKTPEQVRKDLAIGDAPMVLCVARLNKQKDIPTLLRAFSKVLRERSDAQLVLVGTGPEQNPLRSLIADLALEHAVISIDRYDNPANLYGTADVVVVSSVWEGGPLVAEEALRAGAPLLSTPVGFVPDLLIDGENGRLFNVGDDDQLSRALLEILGDPATWKKKAQAGAHHVEAQLDPPRLVAQVETVYQAALRSE